MKHFFAVEAEFFDVTQRKSQAPFVACVVPLLIMIFFEFSTVLIDSVVGQVHKQVIQIVLCWRFVLLCRKAAKTFVEKIDS